MVKVETNLILQARDVTVYYADKPAVADGNLDVEQEKIPAGAGIQDSLSTRTLLYPWDFWIPAFAGMTVSGQGVGRQECLRHREGCPWPLGGCVADAVVCLGFLDSGLRRNDDISSRIWIPAFAGMTVGTGIAVGAGMMMCRRGLDTGAGGDDDFRWGGWT